MTTNDLTSNLIILKEFSKTFLTGKNKYYKCQCKCGKIFDIAKQLVDSGKRNSCRNGKCNIHVLNMIGKKFGRLTVISHISRIKGYKCQCDCGKETIARTFSLKNGSHKSCGCLMREIQANRLYKGKDVAAKKNIFRNYKRAAKKRKYNFDLSEDNFYKLIMSPCHYCNLENSMMWTIAERSIIHDDPFYYNGIDRIDNNIGYNSNNCVPCCKICNNSKSTLSVKDWKSWIVGVHENINKF